MRARLNVIATKTQHEEEEDEDDDSVVYAPIESFEDMKLDEKSRCRSKRTGSINRRRFKRKEYRLSYRDAMFWDARRLEVENSRIFDTDDSLLRESDAA